MIQGDVEKLGFSSQRLERLNIHLQTYIDHNYVAGINAVVLRKGKEVYAASFGRQGEERTAMSKESIFRIYSMTKPITSVAALMLYEEARFMLDEPVSRFLPYFADTKVYAGQEHLGFKLEPQLRPMTIRDLLTHMSGLSYGWYQDTPVDGLYRSSEIDALEAPLAEFVEHLASLPLVFQPGTNWRYSHATDVLAHLIEVVADESFDSFLSSRIFKPLGMDDTSFAVPEEKLERFSTVYCPSKDFSFGVDFSVLPKGKTYPIDTPEKSRFVNPRHLLSGFSGGGGLVSTVPDYSRFAQMLLNGGKFEGEQLLGRKTVELMRKNHVASHIRPLEIGGNDMPGIGFGLGVSVVEDTGIHGMLGSASNYAWSGAAMTSFWIDPVEDMVGIMMTQFMPNDFHRLPDEFKVLVYQALVD